VLLKLIPWRLMLLLLVGWSKKISYLSNYFWRISTVWWLGAKMMIWWYLDLTMLVCGWCCVWLVYYDTWFSNRLQICWYLQNSFEVADGFQICWDLKISCIWLNSTASVLTISSLSTGVHKLSTQGASFWILMGRTLLIRVQKLVSSGISTGWVDVLSDGHWWISIDVL
jgi:hypothetical protein